MTASFTRTQREGETWIDLGNGRLLITNAERQPITLDVDRIDEDMSTEDIEALLDIIQDIAPTEAQFNALTLAPKL